MDVGSSVASGLAETFGPFLPFLVMLAMAGGVMAFPMVGRGPGLIAERDVWRGFKFKTRAIVLERAGGRCEAGSFFGLGRCGYEAVEVDHVFPYSKGGPTVVSNGQALCRDHNRRKRDLTPPWWYVLSLERRRRSYFPADADVRVVARMNALERRARETWLAKQHDDC